MIRAIINDLTPNDFSTPSFVELVNIGEEFFVLSTPPTLWVSDGTSENTSILIDFSEIPGGLLSTISPIEVNGQVFFSASEDQFGEELWVTDGTREGTQVVVDINQVGSSSPGFFTPVGDELFFTTRNTQFSNGFQLWKTDSTAQGTELILENIIPTLSSENLTAVIDDEFFFVGQVFDEGFQSNLIGLYKVNSTGDVQLLPNVSNIRNSLLTVAEDNIFFFGTDSSGNSGLLNTDGTLQDAQFIGDTGTVLSTAVIEDTLFLAINPIGEDVGIELYRTDGDGELELVRDIRPEQRVSGTPINEGSNPENLTNVSGTLFFTADDGVNNRALWKSDGTTEGTELVRVFEDETIFRSFQEINDELYFFTQDGINRLLSLWKSDGTTEGTVQIRQSSEDFSFGSQLLTEFNDMPFFVGSSEQNTTQRQPGLYTLDENSNPDLLSNDPLNDTLLIDDGF